MCGLASVRQRSLSSGIDPGTNELRQVQGGALAYSRGVALEQTIGGEVAQVSHLEKKRPSRVLPTSTLHCLKLCLTPNHVEPSAAKPRQCRWKVRDALQQLLRQSQSPQLAPKRSPECDLVDPVGVRSRANWHLRPLRRGGAPNQHIGRGARLNHRSKWRITPD